MNFVRLHDELSCGKVGGADRRSEDGPTSMLRGKPVGGWERESPGHARVETVHEVSELSLITFRTSTTVNSVMKR
jgi:hypothetical protein